MEKDRRQLLEIQNKTSTESKESRIQESMEQNSIIQKYNFDTQSKVSEIQNSLIQESSIQESIVHESMEQKARILESMIQEEYVGFNTDSTQSKVSGIQNSLIQESLEQKSRILESMIQEEYVESNNEIREEDTSIKNEFLDNNVFSDEISDDPPGYFDLMGDQTEDQEININIDQLASLIKRQSIYVSVTISLITPYHKFSERYKRFFSKALPEFLL